MAQATRARSAKTGPAPGGRRSATGTDRCGCGSGRRRSRPGRQPRPHGRCGGARRDRRCRAGRRPPGSAWRARRPPARRRVSGEQTAALLRVGGKAVRDHLVECARASSAAGVRLGWRCCRAWVCAGIAHQGRTVASRTMVTRKPGGVEARREPGPGCLAGLARAGDPLRGAQPPRPPRLRHPRGLRVRHRAQGSRGEVSPTRPGVAAGRLRPDRRRRALAPRRPPGARTSTPPDTGVSIRSGLASCCFTVDRSTSSPVGSPRRR